MVGIQRLSYDGDSGGGMVVGVVIVEGAALEEGTQKRWLAEREPADVSLLAAAAAAAAPCRWWCEGDRR